MGGYSEFRLIHRLGLFFCFVFLVFRILNFTIFLGLGEKVVIFFRVLVICRYWGHFQNCLFFGVYQSSRYFKGIVRIGDRTSVELRVVFYLVLTALFLLYITSMPLPLHCQVTVGTYSKHLYIQSIYRKINENHFYKKKARGMFLGMLISADIFWIWLIYQYFGYG